MAQIYDETLRNLPVSISTSGDNTIIAAPGVGKRLAIDHLNYMPASAVNVTLKSGSNSLSGAYPLTTSQGSVFENVMANDHGVIECNDNEAFIINLSGAVQLSGFVKYRIIGE
jgi:hypothetical protein